MAVKFTGTHYRTLDSKGRLSLPPSWLQALAKNAEEEKRPAASFWLTTLYNRITAYMPGEWENIIDDLCSIKTPNQKLANFKTRFIGLGEEMIPDAQGRIRLPQSLCRAAGLTKNIVLVGMMKNFEIWDEGRFENLAENTEDVANELSASGINIIL